MPSRTNNKKKKNKKPKKNSMKEFLERTVGSQPSEEELDTRAATYLLQATRRNAKAEAEDADFAKKMTKKFAEAIEVTPEVIARIQKIPSSDSIMWYVEAVYEDPCPSLPAVNMMTCNLYLLDNKNHDNLDDTPNDYSVDNVKNRIAMQLTMCTKTFIRSKAPSPLARKLHEKNLVMGTIAKTMLGEGLIMNEFLTSMQGKKNDDLSMKPRRIFLNNSGLMDKIAPILQEMGMPKKSIVLAHSELIQEASVRNKYNRRCTLSNEKKKPVDPNNADESLIRSVRVSKALEGIPYVSETPQPLRKYTTTTVPMHWLCRPPPQSSYTPEQLYGWRTNLELAVTHMDEAKVKEIVGAHSAEEVREFCEIRLLLTKMAGEGLVKACKLLLNVCNVSVDGGRDSDFSPKWKKYLNKNGWSEEGETPLIMAAKDGQYEACKLLLEHKASIEIKSFKMQAAALQHATEGGHKDIVKLLCKHQADLTSQNVLGSDAIDFVQMLQKPGMLAKNGGCLEQYQKIEEILREYDDRCATCKKKPAVLRRCPCRKEQYCGVECQKQRWAAHKALHKKTMKKVESSRSA